MTAANILRVTEWAESASGKFRVLVLERCPRCEAPEAHAVEFEGETPQCWACQKTVETEAKPMIITVFKEWSEHRAECVKCAYAARTGGANCDAGAKIYRRVGEHEKRRETPWLVRRVRSFGSGHTETRTTALWREREARAWASVHGGEVIDQTHLYHVAV